MKIFKWLVISTIFAASPVIAEDVTEIVKKAVFATYYKGNSQKSQIDMRIIDNQGRERHRNMTMLRQNMIEGYGPQKYYVYFNKPSDIKKMVFMAWKNINRNDDRWLYLPALDLVKRIAASDERTSFVGSDFFYEDVSGRNIDEDNHELILDEDNYFVIKSVPKNSKKVEFSYYLSWIDKKTYLLSKSKYYDKNEMVYRAYTVLDVESIDGFPTVISAQMENILTGGKTIVSFSSVKYDLELPEKFFTERYLRNPAKKYIR